MADEFDPFKGGSGLKENFDGTITRVQFVKDAQARNWSAQMHIVADDQEEIEPKYGLGSGWSSFDGGDSVEHENKSPHTLFNNQTAYWGWIAAAMGSGAEDLLRERNKACDNRGPQFASLWEGLRFHFDIVQAPIRVPVVGEDGKQTGEWKDSTTPRLIPQKFLGLQGDQGSQTAAPTASTATTAGTASSTTTASTGGSTNGVAGSLSAEDSAKLKVLARSNTFAEFVDAVMGLTDSNGVSMLENREVMAALSQESFYESMKG
jgi:hypothetical protein